MNTCVLYAVIDPFGHQVYIGQTSDPRSRAKAHQKARPGWIFGVISEGHESGASLSRLESSTMDEWSAAGWTVVSSKGGGVHVGYAGGSAREQHRLEDPVFSEYVKVKNSEAGKIGGPRGAEALHRLRTEDEKINAAWKAGSRKGGHIGGLAQAKVRRRCSCGFESTPGGLGTHQKARSHFGWVAL